MKVAVLINSNAGRAEPEGIKNSIRRALFRADLTFFEPTSREELQTATLEAAKTSDALIICGGDGTLNVAVQPLLQHRNTIAIPPILPLPLGTANDLASELGVSERIERGARLVLESQPKFIDVIEVSSEKSTVYMLTNGGLGIAAETALLANDVRTWFRKNPVGSDVVKAIGSEIYEILLAGQFLTGHTRKWLKGWCLSVELAEGTSFDTSAPFIMVNNQPGLGGKYIPAPLTSNTDGTFNVMLVNSPEVLRQVSALIKMRRGNIPDENICPRTETTHARFRAKDGARDLTFFGDGEILQSGVRQVDVTCLKRALPVYSQSAVAEAMS